MKMYKNDCWNLVWLESSSVKQIWQILSSNGAKVYFVGGCVRDTILGQEINDIDIATDALPSAVVKLAQAAGLKVIKTGYSFGSVSVLIKRKCFEITTFRSDLVTDGRHPTVGFSSNILDDAKRRDFTMNAIYMTINGDILDPVFGWRDLVNRRVRFIGEPRKRINEDYLRVLRYFRFLSIYGVHSNSLDDTLASVFSDSIPGIKTLSSNRLWEELERILLADYPVEVLKLMQSCHVLDEILPFAKIENLERFLKTEYRLEPKFKAVNRLAVLNLSHVGSWIKKFPIKKEQRRWLDKLFRVINDSSSPKVKGFKYGLKLTTAALVVLKSDLGEKLNQNELDEIYYGSLHEFPLLISDLTQFFSPSKEFGDELKRLKDVWFASELELERTDLLNDLKKNLDKKS